MTRTLPFAAALILAIAGTLVTTTCSQAQEEYDFITGLGFGAATANPSADQAADQSKNGLQDPSGLAR